VARRSKSKRLAVWMNGEQVGNWNIDAQGQHEFCYEQAWIDAEDARPISLSMPLRPQEAPYRGSLIRGRTDFILLVRFHSFTPLTASVVVGIINGTGVAHCFSRTLLSVHHHQTSGRAFLIMSCAELSSRERSSATGRMLSGSPRVASLSG
jgi:HipA N-terminal domain